MTVTGAAHPLVGARLAVEGRRRVGGVACLVVRLPDGTPGTIEVRVTSAHPAGSEASGAGALLSADGVRRLRRLLAGSVPGGDVGSGT